MTTTGGPASYVELLSCLEILRDAKSIEATDPLAGDMDIGHEPCGRHSRATNSQPACGPAGAAAPDDSPGRTY